MNHGVHMKLPRYVTETRAADGSLLAKEPEKARRGSRPPWTAEVADKEAEAMGGVTEPGGHRPRRAQDFKVLRQDRHHNDSTDAWFIGCARSPQNILPVRVDGLRGPELRRRSRPQLRRHEGRQRRQAGLRRDAPATIFDRTFEILREIQAAKGRAANWRAAASPPPRVREPEPARRPRRGRRRAQRRPGAAPAAAADAAPAARRAGAEPSRPEDEEEPDAADRDRPRRRPRRLTAVLAT
jgi:membrane peptidoglycan carboxypeptidase